ncbi:MAG: glycoside hydrolase family 28 protein [Eubacteriales bacterium]
MKIKKIYVSSCSAVFEIENDMCLNSPQKYNVYLNEKMALENVDTNVFSIYNLNPDTEYEIKINLSEESNIFNTKKESCCINVLDFYAVGDGKKDDTKAIQLAVNTCPENGRVQIPAGIYHISPITLKSNITIEIMKDAVLLGSMDEDDYSVLPGEVPSSQDGKKLECVSWEGCPVASHQSLLSAYHAHDIHIVGEGIVDGNAQNSTWWINPKQRKIARPKIFFTNKCRNIFVSGVTFKNSPCWHLHPYNSTDLGFYDIKIIAPKDSPNTDGCNPESCDRVEIIGAHFSVGDDAIAIKSGKMYEGKAKNIPASNHTIRNCLMEYAHGAVVLGSEMSGGVKDLSVTQCLFKNTDRGLRIKTRRGRGKDAVIDGITFENIIMDGVLTPLVVNMYYFCDPDGKSGYVQNKSPLPVDDRTPYLGRFYFRNMVCNGCSVAAGFFYGLPEQPIEEIQIENVKIAFRQDAEYGHPAMMSDIEECTKLGLYFNNVKKVKLSNIDISGAVGEKVITQNVSEITEQ